MHKKAEVEDLVPVVPPVLFRMFEPVGLLQFPTKPIPISLSNCTYVQGSPPMNYEHSALDVLSSEVPQVYTTITTEQQSEEKMMDVNRKKEAFFPESTAR